MPGLRPFRSIASALIRKTFLLATICALLVCLLQAAYTYRSAKARTAANLHAVVQAHLPLLSLNVWDIEPAAVQAQLAALCEQPSIAFVRVDTLTGHSFQAGDASQRERAPLQRFNLSYPRAATGSVGELMLVPNPAVVYEEVFYSVLGVVLGYGLLTLLICVFTAGLLRRELQRPMRAIAEFVSQLSPRSLTAPLKLQRGKRMVRDEIDLVADGFRTLQEGISGHIENLDRLVEDRTKDLEAALSALRLVAMTDPLTGCFNRRHFDERFPREVERAMRYGRPLSVMFCDLDHFKVVNDSHGHAAGDEVLRKLVERFRNEIRNEVDWVARFGGEEFIIVLPETGLIAATAMAERLRASIEAARITLEAATISITASFGVAELSTGEASEGLLARADALLYQAKQSGRNKVLPAPAGDAGKRA